MKVLSTKHEITITEIYSNKAYEVIQMSFDESDIVLLARLVADSSLVLFRHTRETSYEEVPKGSVRFKSILLGFASNKLSL